MPIAAQTGTSLREIENGQQSDRERRSLQDRDMNSNGSHCGSEEVEKNGGRAGSSSGENEKMGSGAGAGAGIGMAVSSSPPLPQAPRREVSVTAGSAWKSAFTKFLPNRSSEEDDMGIDWNDPLDPTRKINQYGPDLMALWSDPGVRQLLRVQKLRLEELPGL